MRTYTYIYCTKPTRMICLIDQNAEWKGQSRANGIPFVGLATTDNHPKDWNTAYKQVTFTEFSKATGVTMDSLLGVQ